MEFDYFMTRKMNAGNLQPLLTNTGEKISCLLG